MGSVRRVVQVVPSLGVGGAEAIAAELAQAQLEAGLDVHLLAITAGGPLMERLSPELRARTKVIGRAGRYDPTLIPRLARRLRELAPEVAHLHLFTALAWGAPAARLAGVPAVVFTQHAAHREAAGLARAVERIGAAAVDRFVFCSPAAAATARRLKYPLEHLDLVENGIALAGRARASLDGQPPRIGAVGRLDPVKGHVHLVEAVRLLRAQGRRVRAVIYGEGPERTRLEARIAAAGLEGVIELPGQVADVPARLAGLDVFVQPSLSEALPLAVLEAMAAGLPVVVTDQGGAAELVRQGAGGAVARAGDPSSLAEALAGVLDQPLAARRAAGEAGHALVHARYGLATTAARYLTVYEEALAGR